MGSISRCERCHEPRHLQGLRHPRALRDRHRRRNGRADRAGVRARHRRDRGQADHRAAARARARHAPDRAGDGARVPRGDVRRGCHRGRRRRGRDRDALLPGRVAGARRRADVHGLAQPQALHRREAGPARRGGAVGRCGDRRGAGEARSRPRRRTRRRLGRARPAVRGVPGGRARVHRPGRGAAYASRRRRRQWDGRAHGRATAPGVGTRSHRDVLGAQRALPRPRAEPAAAREPRVHHARGGPVGRGSRDRLGRRRRPLLLHRRYGDRSSTATS